jgi:hypothetical protein
MTEVDPSSEISYNFYETKKIDNAQHNLNYQKLKQFFKEIIRLS